MYTLVFNGEFQLNYPSEFLSDLEELKDKHNVIFVGQPIIKNLGNYVDYQKVVETETVKGESEISNKEINN